MGKPAGAVRARGRCGAARERLDVDRRSADAVLSDQIGTGDWGLGTRDWRLGTRGNNVESRCGTQSAEDTLPLRRHLFIERVRSDRRCSIRANADPAWLDDPESALGPFGGE